MANRLENCLCAKCSRTCLADLIHAKAHDETERRSPPLVRNDER